MIDLYLTDEDIHALNEPSFEEREINKLKMDLINANDKVEIAEHFIKRIEVIVIGAINDNVKKTNREHSVPVIKSYRESLLILRAIEKELKDYNEQITS